VLGHVSRVILIWGQVNYFIILTPSPIRPGRLDIGYHFSARIGNIEEPEEDEAENEEVNSEYDRKAKIISDLKEKASQIEYRDMEGKSVLPLSWQPDSDDEDSV